MSADKNIALDWCRRSLPAVAALGLMLAPGRSEAAGSGNTTFTVSTTTSGTATVIVPGGGPLAGALQQVLSGPNGAVVAGRPSIAIGFAQ